MQNTFSFEQLDSLNFNDQKNYLTQYFVPLSNGSHCMLKDGLYEMMTDEVINKVYLKRCGKKLREYYTEEYRVIRTPVYEINKPVFMKIKLIFVLNYRAIHLIKIIQKLFRINAKYF